MRPQAYCEIMRELGRWDAALAAAPAVGLDYWAGLMAARATEQLESGAAPDEVRKSLCIRSPQRH